MSRISTRFFASAGLRGGEPLGDCSARRVVDTMKGISWDSTPSFTRSSGEIGGKSGERHLVSGVAPKTLGGLVLTLGDLGVGGHVKRRAGLSMEVEVN